MGWKKTDEEKQAIADHKAAKRDLARHTDADSPEYLADHDRVVAAEKSVPWYRR
ncbi:hypothetical protein [Streptomyces nigrescens]|uniref:Uncharacterized protein n=1 Tax=Streptomyces nigrescens TaxID=1920 RepID=A0A640TA61_STRNI|nr:hypothetical protein [Streptomyces libani]WAT94911.1 hypothetical protein STRLI_000583 [Streptomyces libani subsp. libani]GFE20060.1 hypothetical protein Sliba_05130 [Streptomyces libani subsp. libani]GGV85712.1 hypothetical protein GCM10010500_02660 [Streptomyces libani subsp. libani]